MSHNSFGHLFRITTWGESHGPAIGCVVDGYCSDMTRTVVVGEPDARQREIYDLVLRAQQAGLEAIRAGRTGKEVDAEAPVRYDDADGAPIEEVARLTPDVILATNSGITKEEYTKLSKIAPVVAYPEAPWGHAVADLARDGRHGARAQRRCGGSRR